MRYISAQPEELPKTQRLVSWKAIAAYFACTERTAKRWERERGLPVHRTPGAKRGYVFAYIQELDQWLRATRAENLKGEHAKSLQEPQVEPWAGREAATPMAGIEGAVAMATGPRNRFANRSLLVGAVSAAILACVGGSLWFVLRKAAHPPHTFTRAADLQDPSRPSPHIPRPEVEQLYLRGRYYWSLRTAESLSKAIEAYNQAINQDPAYAEPYAGLAETYDLLPQFGPARLEDAMLQARSAAEKALELNPNLAAAHRAKAFEMFFWDWDIRGSDAEFQLAISLDPGAAETHHWYASTLINRLEANKAMRQIDEALSLNPTSPAIVIDAAFVHASFDQDRQAWTHKLEDLERSQPALVTPSVFLRDIYFGSGDFPAFLAELKRIASITHNPDDADMAEDCARGWNSGGKPGLLQGRLKALRKAFHRGTESGFYLAQTYLLLGRIDEALPFFQASLKQHFILLISMERCNYAKTLSSRPGYAALFAQIHERMHNAPAPQLSEAPLDFQLPL
jgi:tetratricopeptide (TPR) repeat protein